MTSDEILNSGCYIPRIVEDLTFTKEEVLKALDVEQLRAGSWVERSNLDIVGDCKVCAVGALLRIKGMINSRIHEEASFLTKGYYAVQYEDVDDLDENVVPEKVTDQCARGNYLGALSIYFEFLAHKNEISIVPPKHPLRGTLKKWVTEIFPEQFTVMT